MQRRLVVMVLVCIVIGVMAAPIAAQTTTYATDFTYQGYIENAGTPVSAACDFTFALFNAITDGAPVGTTQSATGVTVTDGVFSTVLDFGTGAFNGEDRWLEIAVNDCAGGGAFTTLTPRQVITPAPYALALYGLRVEPNATSPNVIGGFVGNNVTNDAVGVTISGGGALENANSANASLAVIGGGSGNTASSVYTTVGGGSENTANGFFATVGGGSGNTASGFAGTVGGGDENTASGLIATVGGGANNIVTGSYATVSGGTTNTASGDVATVGGGNTNAAIGGNSTIPGGVSNIATGTASFAAGNNANAAHNGAFVWADNTGAEFASTAINQFNVRAAGGVRIFTNSAATIGVSLDANDSSWNVLSDRAAKDAFAAVDPRAVLDAVAGMPITTWEYIGGDTRHIGPVAQDFYAAFGVGSGETTISTVDADGVALAAIQGLNLELQGEIASRDAQINALQTLAGVMLAALVVVTAAIVLLALSLRQVRRDVRG